MEIRIRETGQVVTEQEFRILYPNTSFPSILSIEILESLGADAILEGPQVQTSDPYHYSQRSGVEEINGKWFTKYILGPIFTEYKNEKDELVSIKTQEAEYKSIIDGQQASAVRSTRNQKLKDSDWTQGKDIAETVSAAWSEYRQALRDVPGQTGFPWDIEWPEEPKL